MSKKEELQKRLALNSLKNLIKNNLPSFTLEKIYEDNDIEIAYYKEKMKDFWQLWHTNRLSSKKIHIGNSDEYYCKWILSEIPDLNHYDEWLIYGEGYWAKVKASDRLYSIRDLWHIDKPEAKRLGYHQGFCAVNLSLRLIVDVGIHSDDEYHCALSTKKI